MTYRTHKKAFKHSLTARNLGYRTATVAPAEEAMAAMLSGQTVIVDGSTKSTLRCPPGYELKCRDVGNGQYECKCRSNNTGSEDLKDPFAKTVDPIIESRAGSGDPRRISKGLPDMPSIDMPGVCYDPETRKVWQKGTGYHEDAKPVSGFGSPGSGYIFVDIRGIGKRRVELCPGFGRSQSYSGGQASSPNLRGAPRLSVKANVRHRQGIRSGAKVAKKSRKRRGRKRRGLRLFR